MRWPWILALLAPAGCARETREAADLVFFHAKVMTRDPERPEATAIAIQGDRIVAVGDDEEVLERASTGAEQIDLGGGFVLPGLIDSHVHLRSLGEQLTAIDLRGVGSVDEVVRLVTEAAPRIPEDEWIEGIGWDQNLWPGASYPDHRPITEAVPARAVWLQRIDWYAGWASLPAMEAAGVDRATPDPPGGRILRDANGDPTGVFLGEAMNLVSRAMPKRSRERLKELLRPALARMAEVGLTGVHDAAATFEEAAAFRELAEAGELPVRVYLMWKGYGGEEPVERMLEEPILVDYHGRLTHRTLKLLIDGTMGSRGALFFEDYSDEPGNRGFFVTPFEDIERLTKIALQKNYQVATHAIGDRGIRLVVDAFEKALAEAAASDPRPRIEHLQSVALDDLPRIARLGITASMQPIHATSEHEWSELRVGSNRGRGLYAFRTVLDAGIRIAGGSDLPVDREEPLLGIHAAVTRQDRRGLPPGGWHPGERLTLDEAIRAYTGDAAYAAFEDDRKGRIAPGFWADLTVLDKDLRAIPPEEIPSVKVTHTVVGGRVVYRNVRISAPPRP